MTTYRLDVVLAALKEVCAQFAMTKAIEVKEAIYDGDEERYVVTLGDGSKHFLEKELINTYIESVGDRGGIRIAGSLLHSIELEESGAAAKSEKSSDEDFWDGDINDVTHYLEKKKKEENP